MSASTFTLGALQTDAALGLSYRVRLPQPTRCLILLHGVGSNETHRLDLATFRCRAARFYALAKNAWPSAKTELGVLGRAFS